MYALLIPLGIYISVVFEHLINFERIYDRKNFIITEQYISNEEIYIRESQDECQNAEKWPLCEEMILNKKIGSCHEKRNIGSCFGEYDDLGYQVNDYYSGEKNHYPRSVIYLRTVWTLNITLYNDIFPQNLTFSDTNYSKILSLKNEYHIGGVIRKAYIYRANGTLVSKGNVIYDVGILEFFFLPCIFLAFIIIAY